jgi:hypothetical protein
MIPRPNRRLGENRVERVTAEEAEILALRALGHLAQDQQRIQRFLDLTGIDPGSLRALASRPDFLLAVLDHLASDEEALLQFCTETITAPEKIAAARRALGGGDAM